MARLGHARGAQIRKRRHERQGFEWRRLEAHRQIEGGGLSGYGVDQDASDSDRLGCVDHALGGVADERATKTLVLTCAIDRQSAKHRHRNRIGHIAPKPWRRRDNCHRSGGERVIGDNARTLANDVSSGRAARLIGAGAASQPVVESGNAAVESGEFVGVGYRARWTGRRTGLHSQGALVVIMRRNFSFGAGAASRRSTKRA